jgi:transcription initiation factor IIE alpha subunit
MRPAEFEGFYYLCPANKDNEGWHSASHHLRVCVQCGANVRVDNSLSRWVLDVTYLIISEEPDITDLI